MKNILVTGGAGFIGSNFIHSLLPAEPDVYVVNVDALTYAGRLKNLAALPAPDRHHFVHGDICDRALLDDLFHRHQIDTVVHFAAESHVDRSLRDPSSFLRTNILGTHTLLEAARRAWLIDRIVPVSDARFLHISTDEVFGALGPNDPPFREDTAYAPRSPYSASKAAADHLVQSFFISFGLPTLRVNSANNFGPRQFPEKLIPLTMLMALHEQPIPLYGNGLQIRDWLHVDDHTKALRQVLAKGTPGQVYLVGGGNQPTNLQVVQLLCDAMDELRPRPGGHPHRELIHFVGDRPGHDMRYAVDISKIRTELGWEPRIALEEGLRQTARWFLEQRDWLESAAATPAFRNWLEQNYARR